jgi:periplasmic protein TonB
MNLLIATSAANTSMHGHADWSKAPSPTLRQAATQPDRKRILALSAVVISHVIAFGAMMLPMEPFDPIRTFGDTEILIFEADPPPPPPPEPEEVKPRQIVDRTPRPTPIDRLPPAPLQMDAPVIASLASVNFPTEEAAPITNIISPATDIGSSTGPDSVLEVLRAPPPPYTDLRTSGTLEFVVHINANGSVDKIEMTQSTGSRKLDRTALQHIKRKWRFKAPEVNGVAQAGRGRGKVSFKLEG